MLAFSIANNTALPCKSLLFSVQILRAEQAQFFHAPVSSGSIEFELMELWSDIAVSLFGSD
jgi:hypothetical protein